MNTNDLKNENNLNCVCGFTLVGVMDGAYLNCKYRAHHPEEPS